MNYICALFVSFKIRMALPPQLYCNIDFLSTQDSCLIEYHILESSRFLKVFFNVLLYPQYFPLTGIWD